MQTRRQRRQRRHRGGSGRACLARPINRSSFGQRGGVAPIGSDGYLIQGAMRSMAGVAGTDTAFADSQMYARQTGAGRSRRSRRSRRKHTRKH